jgi:hypothetical protein
MPPRSPSTRRWALAAAGTLAVTAGIAGIASSSAPAARPVALSDNAKALLKGASGGEDLAAFVSERHLNTRSQAVAQMMEKLENGGEATQGPSQEAYENRAFPATDVAPAQVATARSAFAKKGRGSKGFTQVGPDGGTVPGPVTYTGNASNVSGRTTAILPVGDCTAKACTVLVGSAGGGVWRTTQALAADPTWTSVGTGITSNAIGSLTLSGSTVYAGTGEPNGSSDNEAGTGLFASTDGGSTFSRVPTTLATGKDFAVGRSVSSVVVDRADTKHLLVGTMVARHGSSSVNGGRFTPPGSEKVGLYETTDAGTHWALAHAESSDPVDPANPTGGDLFRGGVTRVEQDPTQASTFYASFSDYGLFRRTGAGEWQHVFTSTAAGLVSLSGTARTEFDAVALPSGKTRVYLGDAIGTNGTPALYRTDDARAVAGTGEWTVLSKKTPGTDPGAFASYNYCGQQCSYDMPVASPDGSPDVVYIGGQMQYDEIFTAHQPSNGRAVQRSSDAGRSFTDMTNDTTGNGLHPDQHAIAFAGGATFLASDGGVNRLSGGYADASADCAPRGLTAVQLVDCKAWLAAVPSRNTAINKGLQTLEFQSASVSHDGNQLLAGAQDNGTWSLGQQGQQSFESVGGDGGQSGFDAVDSSVRYHSYYSPQHDVNFRGSDPLGWTFISDPLLASKEAASFYTPLTADPVVGGTVFDGLQHVWRSKDSGGDQAYLTTHCNEFTGDFSATCGDWQALGQDLTGTAFGPDKSGSYVVAIARSTKDAGTMWAATRRGRVFVTHNADAADPKAVVFTRVDTAATPTRFVSGIALDPADPDHAFLSYSGYDAYAKAAGTAAGHVFDVRYSAGKAAFTDLSGDLGDLPVTSVALDAASSTLYLGTDFGVLAAQQPTATASWTTVPGLPVVAVYGLTLDPAKRTIYAATHGRGLWATKL